MRSQFSTAGQIPGYPGMDPLLHPGAGAYQRNPGMIPQRDAVLSLHPDILGRPYPPDLAHHVSSRNASGPVALAIHNLIFVPISVSPFQFTSAHEQIQRQMLMDRERFPHPGAGGPNMGPHPSFLAQQEEYLRYLNNFSQK